MKSVDVVTCLEGGHMVVHEPKTRVDCSKRVESSAFTFDDVFDEAAGPSTHPTYIHAVI